MSYEFKTKLYDCCLDDGVNMYVSYCEVRTRPAVVFQIGNEPGVHLGKEDIQNLSDFLNLVRKFTID